MKRILTLHKSFILYILWVISKEDRHNNTKLRKWVFSGSREKLQWYLWLEDDLPLSWRYPAFLCQALTCASRVSVSIMSAFAVIMAFSAEVWAVLQLSKAFFTASVVAFTFSAWCLDNKIVLITLHNSEKSINIDCNVKCQTFSFSLQT